MEKNLHKYGECREKFSKNHQLHAGLRPVGWGQKRGEALCEMTDSVPPLHPGLQGESPLSMSRWGGWVLEMQSHQITPRRANHATNTGNPSATSLLCPDTVWPRVQESHGSVRNVGTVFTIQFPHSTQSPAGHKPCPVKAFPSLHCCLE